LEFAGHQLVAHLTDRAPEQQAGVYPRHFSLILTSEAE
jgi:extradiol dioxygenase family protein